ncbi:MAG: hypothetical protein ACLTY5_10810 [Angelakisella sp.]
MTWLRRGWGREHRLQTLEECYPGFTAERREEQMDADYWER